LSFEIIFFLRSNHLALLSYLLLIFQTLFEDLVEILLQTDRAVGRVILKVMQSICELSILLLVENDEGREIVIDEFDELIDLEFALEVTLKDKDH
jgi:hypothetical protein